MEENFFLKMDFYSAYKKYRAIKCVFEKSENSESMRFSFTKETILFANQIGKLIRKHFGVIGQ